VLLGFLVGIWSGLFTHYMLRDCVYSHIRRIANAGDRLTKEETFSYIMHVTFLVSTIYLFTICNGLLSQHINTVEQSWMVNMSERCGVEFDSDEAGLLDPSSNGMYSDTIVE
jgi:hypothetical protein